jgi:glycosyltransferase involved in cell wall biosynthesis
MTTIDEQGLLILLDSSPKTWGSREELHLRFSQALIARGVRPVLVFSETLSDELQNKYRANGIEVAAVSYEKGIFHFYRELGELIKSYSATAVHIAFFNYFSLIPWMARLRGVRHIVYHERNPGVLRAKSWKLRLLRLRTRATTLPISRVIVISVFVKQQLMAVGVPEEKIYLVYNGVDTERFSPDPNARKRLAAAFSIRPDELIVATLTYLNPHKNVDVIVEACGQLAKRGVALRLFVVGDGRMRAELEALSRKLGVADRVHWLGHILDPVPVLQACDIFIMASTGEGFGLALAEAMASGAAAIAVRSGALPEIVEDGTSGILLPPRNVAALADAIQHLGRDEGLRREMARRGLIRVRNLFSADASIEGLMRVYDSLLRS